MKRAFFKDLGTGYPIVEKPVFTSCNYKLFFGNSSNYE